LDEPTSALDVSIQAQILNLLVDLKNELGLSYLLITHDLSIVRYIGDRIIVMYLGRVMEAGLSEEIFNEPLHPYTQALFSSIPDPYYRESRRISLRGESPSPINPPPGCRFHTRCPHAMEICERKEPPEYETSKSHKVYCWLYIEK
jgi:oligopeptide/dipeptide ABC transporter ATP-binding protein